MPYLAPYGDWTSIFRLVYLTFSSLLLYTCSGGNGKNRAHINPYMTNGFSHHYHLEESTFIFRGVRSDFYFFISFFDEISLCKQNSPRWDMGRRVLRRHIWGYSVCLCPTKGTPGLNELSELRRDKKQSWGFSKRCDTKWPVQS